MNYNLKLTYKDAVTLDLILSEEEAKNLFVCLNSQSIYWTKEAKKGFWTNIADIRYIHILQLENDESTGNIKEPDTIAVNES